MLQKSSVGGNKIEQTFPESTLDYSQGFSATHFQVSLSLSLSLSLHSVRFCLSTRDLSQETHYMCLFFKQVGQNGIPRSVWLFAYGNSKQPVR